METQSSPLPRPPLTSVSSNITLRSSRKASSFASADRPPSDETGTAWEAPLLKPEGTSLVYGPSASTEHELGSGEPGSANAASDPGDVALRLWRRFSTDASELKVDDGDSGGDESDEDGGGDPQTHAGIQGFANRRDSLDHASIIARTKDAPITDDHETQRDEPLLKAMSRSRLGKKTAPWRKLRNAFASVSDLGPGATKKILGRSRVSGENLPSPDFVRRVSSAVDAQKGHEPAWQLRMLTSCEGGEAGSADSDASLSELANALRSGVSQNLADPDWLSRLHAFRSELERRGHGSVAMSDFRQLLRVMFKVNIGDVPLRRIFDSLDSARRGRIDWRTVLDFMTPVSSGDVVTCPCSNVVTCMALSADCRVVGFGGVGFVRAVCVASG